MKRWAGAVLACAALAGCSSEQPAPADTQAAKDAIYLEMAREAMPGAKDENLLTVRKQTCDVLRSKPTPAGYAAIIGAAVQNGLSAEVAGKLTALSVTSACPEFGDLVGG